MATFAIGDLQGCYSSLQHLLKTIQYKPEQDFLWFTGDLVNRGPESLQTLRFVKKLTEENKAITVLGNHDLHLLAVAHLTQPLKPHDTFSDILNASDKNDLCNWLRQQPLLHHDSRLGFTLMHAGLHPQWDLSLAQRCATEVETVLQSQQCDDFLSHMYGDKPDSWNEKLEAWDRLRFITNCFTRIRFCDTEGHLDLTTKGLLDTQKPGFMPWFSVPHRKNKELKLLFGHWAALYDDWEKIKEPHIFPLDSGCVWGNCLTAMRLEDRKKFHVKCKKTSAQI